MARFGLGADLDGGGVTAPSARPTLASLASKGTLGGGGMQTAQSGSRLMDDWARDDQPQATNPLGSLGRQDTLGAGGGLPGLRGGGGLLDSRPEPGLGGLGLQRPDTGVRGSVASFSLGNNLGGRDTGAGPGPSTLRGRLDTSPSRGRPAGGGLDPLSDPLGPRGGLAPDPLGGGGPQVPQLFRMAPQLQQRQDNFGISGDLGSGGGLPLGGRGGPLDGNQGGLRGADPLGGGGALGTGLLGGGQQGPLGGQSYGLGSDLGQGSGLRNPLGNPLGGGPLGGPLGGGALGGGLGGALGPPQGLPQQQQPYYPQDNRGGGLAAQLGARGPAGGPGPLDLRGSDLQQSYETPPRNRGSGLGGPIRGPAPLEHFGLSAEMQQAGLPPVEVYGLNTIAPLAPAESPRMPKKAFDKEAHERRVKEGLDWRSGRDAFATDALEFVKRLNVPETSKARPSILQRLVKKGANLPSSILEPQLDATGLVMPDLRWDRATGAAERFRSVPSFAVTLVKASPIPRTEVQRAVVARVARVCLMEGKHTFLSNVLAVNANMTDVNGIQKWKFQRPQRIGAANSAPNASAADSASFVIRSDLLRAHPGLMVYIEFNVVHEGYLGEHRDVQFQSALLRKPKQIDELTVAWCAFPFPPDATQAHELRPKLYAGSVVDPRALEATRAKAQSMWKHVVGQGQVLKEALLTLHIAPLAPKDAHDAALLPRTAVVSPGLVPVVGVYRSLLAASMMRRAAGAGPGPLAASCDPVLRILPAIMDDEQMSEVFLDFLSMQPPSRRSTADGLREAILHFWPLFHVVVLPPASLASDVEQQSLRAAIIRRFKDFQSADTLGDVQTWRHLPLDASELAFSPVAHLGACAF